MADPLRKIPTTNYDLESEDEDAKMVFSDVDEGDEDEKIEMMKKSYPLHLAVLMDSEEDAKSLISGIKRGFIRGPSTIDEKGYIMVSGWTCLYCAAYRGSQELVAILCDMGASVNAFNDDGTTPIFVAAAKGSLAISKFLCEKGANCGYEDASGLSPLHHAATCGRTDVIELLLAHGADVNAQTFDRSESALHLAASASDGIVAKALIDAGAIVYAKDIFGRTPMHIVAEKDEWVMLSAMLERNPNIEARDEAGNTALMLAVKSNNPRIAKTLLEHGADVQALNGDFVTALHIACMNNYIKITKYLLGYGAAVNAICPEGKTPLDYAEIYERKVFRAKRRERQLRAAQKWKLRCKSMAQDVLLPEDPNNVDVNVDGRIEDAGLVELSVTTKSKLLLDNGGAAKASIADILPDVMSAATQLRAEGAEPINDDVSLPTPTTLPKSTTQPSLESVVSTDDMPYKSRGMKEDDEMIGYEGDMLVSRSQIMGAIVAEDPGNSDDEYSSDESSEGEAEDPEELENMPFHGEVDRSKAKALIGKVKVLGSLLRSVGALNYENVV